MITPGDIVTHLKDTLPRLRSDVFTVLEPTATALGSVVTFTLAGHGLTAGQNVIVAEARYRNSLASVTQNANGSYRFVTNFDHDVTMPVYSGDPSTVTLGGFGNAWDGAKKLVAVPNRRSFDLADIGTAPTVSGAQYLLENREADMKGRRSIATVPDADTFTISTLEVPAYPTGVVQDVRIVTGLRIAQAMDIDRAYAIYTQAGTAQPYIFVIPGDVDVSKDRHTENDAVAANVRGDEIRLTVLQNFSVVAIFDVSSQYTAETAQNECYGQLYSDLLRTFHGFKFIDPNSAINYTTVSTGHGQGRYNTSSYVHVYEFQIPAVVTFSEGWNFQVNAAFRDLGNSFDVSSDTAAVASDNVNLDENPLE